MLLPLTISDFETIAISLISIDSINEKYLFSLIYILISASKLDPIILSCLASSRAPLIILLIFLMLIHFVFKSLSNQFSGIFGNCLK